MAFGDGKPIEGTDEPRFDPVNTEDPTLRVNRKIYALQVGVDWLSNGRTIEEFFEFVDRVEAYLK